MTTNLADLDLYAFVLALLTEGMVAVFVDLGMGKKRVLLRAGAEIVDAR